jgi:hypothetical protein
MKTLRLIIHGRVQGVFFRDAIDAIVRWAHHGPQHARVVRVVIEPDDGSYNSFEVIG